MLVLGIFVGVLPGLGGPNGVAILLPLTFTMDPTSAIVMLSCIYWWRAVRRRHHLNPVQHSRRSLVGRDHLRRLSDGAAGQGGGSADCGLHLILHRFAGRGAADHVPGADDLVVRAEIRTTGILFGVSAHLLLLVGLGLGREAKHKTVISMSLGVLLAGRRHGHGVWPASHDLRFD
jgi:putative tricarboxylic transport membrane protein